MVNLNFWSLVMSSCYGHDWVFFLFASTGYNPCFTIQVYHGIFTEVYLIPFINLPLKFQVSTCYVFLKYCYLGETKRMLTTNIFLITLHQFKHAFALDTFKAVGSGQGQVSGTCDCGNETLGSIKCGEFLDQLKTCQLLLLHEVS